MPDPSNKLFSFWKELKRRKVVRVITVYAAAAFVILELVSIVADPLKLPEWTLAFIIVLLCIGFIISIILSWIYDVTPEGIEKTKPSREIKEGAPETKSRLLVWKIATIISVIAIIGLVLLHIVRSTERSRDIQTLEKSIAVLPFENWSYADEFSHLGNAIANEIITELYNIREFRVLSHTSTLQYEESNKSIPVIGQELGVNYLIEGIVERQEDKVNIHVQVIRVKNEDHIWAEEYDGDWEDIFTIQDDIAFKVAEELKAVLSENEIEVIEQRPTDNMEAYNYYLKGNDFYARGFNQQDFSIAINMYQKAIELDSSFASAYCMLARSHLAIHWHHNDRDLDRVSLSKKAIDAALSIDPDLVDTHIALGIYHYWGFINYPEALKHLHIALENAPNNTELIFTIACVHRRMGNWDQAIEGLVKAVNIEKVSAINAFVTSQTFYLLNQYSESLHYADKSINLDPEFPSSYWQKVLLYLKWEGKTENARKTLEEASIIISPSSNPYMVFDIVTLDILEGNFDNAIRLLNSMNIEADRSQFFYHPKTLILGHIYDLTGGSEEANHNYDLARILLESKIDGSPEDSRYHSALGISYAGLGQKEKAIQAGERAVEIMPISREAFRGVYREEELARIYVMVEEYELALEKLDYLLSIPGNLSVKRLQLDPIWKPLWDQPGFQDLVNKYSEN